MDILYVTIPVTLIFIGIAVAIFFWATRDGQYDDMDGPANRILYDEEDESIKKRKGDIANEDQSDASGSHATDSDQADGEG